MSDTSRYDNPIEMDCPIGELLDVASARAVQIVQETGRSVHFIFAGYHTWAFPGDSVRDVILRRNRYWFFGDASE